MRELRRHGRRGFSLIELLIVVAIILILAAIAAPKLNQNRMHAQETAAIRQVGTIHTAQTQYYSQFGRYAATLAELGPPPSGQATAAASDLIPEDLAKGKKNRVYLQRSGRTQRISSHGGTGRVRKYRAANVLL